MKLSDCTVGLTVAIEDPYHKHLILGHIIGFESEYKSEMKTQADEYNNTLVRVSTGRGERSYRPHRLFLFDNSLELATRSPVPNVDSTSP
jgi:hypothetical protein